MAKKTPRANPATVPDAEVVSEEQPNPTLDLLNRIAQDVMAGTVDGLAYVIYRNDGIVLMGHTGLTPIQLAASPTHMLSHAMSQQRAPGAGGQVN